MASSGGVVITGLGVVSPIGIGGAAFWASLIERRSGVRRLALWAGESADLPVPFGAEVADFDPKRQVWARKSLKMMSREIQLAFTAADLACKDAGFPGNRPDPERLGVFFGADLVTCELPEIVNTYARCMVDGRFEFSRWGPAAMAELYPLWMLKYLPNMPACHVGIAQDARGPNNTITHAEVSGLIAVGDAMRVLQRGQADAMIAGSCGAIHPAVWTRSGGFPFSRRWDRPAEASRPFDAQRDGWVNGEGAAAFLLERRGQAEARGAKIAARVLGYASRFEPHGQGRPRTGSAIAAAMSAALQDAGLSPADVGHVVAQGWSTREDDRIEAQAIRAVLGDVPVTAPSSFYGISRAGSGSLGLAAGVLAVQKRCVPVTLNYHGPDPECPVCVVHSQPLEPRQATALVLGHTRQGQAVAVVLGEA